MNLTVTGHDDRYAVEQLQLALFPDDTEAEAISSLHRGKTWLTACNPLKCALTLRQTVLPPSVASFHS